MNPKVQAASLAGAATVVVVFVAGELGLEVPEYVASAFTALVAGAAGYLKSAWKN